MNNLYKEYIKNYGAFGVAVFALAVSVASCSIQSKELDLSKVVTELEEWGRINEESANRLSTSLVNNSNSELEIYKKKISFEVVEQLYNEVYNFTENNKHVINKLELAADERIKRGKVSNLNKIANIQNLKVYLNTFETIYEQCKRGLISYEDVRVNFKYLIGPTCNNLQVNSVTQDGYNGLLILCAYEYPKSLLGERANIEDGACKK